MTPGKFIGAFEKRFGPIRFDLAAEANDAVSTHYYTKEIDALTKDWGALYKTLGASGWLFLSPPSAGDMTDWVAKCIYESRQGHARIALLHQNSLAKWFVDGVNCHAATYLLSPRVGGEFDSALSLFTPETRGQIAGVWKWHS